MLMWLVRSFSTELGHTVSMFMQVRNTCKCRSCSCALARFWVRLVHSPSLLLLWHHPVPSSAADAPLDLASSNHGSMGSVSTSMVDQLIKVEPIHQSKHLNISVDPYELSHQNAVAVGPGGLSLPLPLPPPPPQAYEVALAAAVAAATSTPSLFGHSSSPGEAAMVIRHV